MKHKKHQAAARRRWITSPKFIAKKRRAELRRDLVLLRKVVQEIRTPLVREASLPRKRAYALARFYKSEKFKKRGRTLAKHFRAALARGEKEKALNRSLLEKGYRRVLWRQASAIETKLAKRLRSRFEKAFRCRQTSRVCAELTGTSLAGLRAHLESRFWPGMNWDNYGFHGWHIDHIKPVSSFTLALPEQARACFHYTNLQPLWKVDNFAKGRKVGCLPPSTPATLCT
jgi:hypothetical protein